MWQVTHGNYSVGFKFTSSFSFFIVFSAVFTLSLVVTVGSASALTA